MLEGPKELAAEFLLQDLADSDVGSWDGVNMDYYYLILH